MAEIGMTGSRIRERREAMGMRQAALAREIGISAAYLNLIEHNRRRIGGRVLNDLARVLAVEPSALTEGAEDALIEALGAVAAGPDASRAEAARAEDFAGRFPGWAGTLVAQARRIEALERTVATLSDRLTHDPFLSESLHDVLSTVSAIRATSSILAETRDIETEWRDRFQRNIFEESARLAESAEALVSYLDAGAKEEAQVSSPQEELEAWLADQGHRIAALEDGSDPEDEIATLTSGGLGASAASLASSYLRRYAEDAAAMPESDLLAEIATEGPDPAHLARRFGAPLDVVLRRLGVCLGAGAGLVTCDASGTLTFRKPVEGFPLPRFGAACPLWPLYQALGQPNRPVRTRIEIMGRQPHIFLAYAVATTRGPADFDSPQVVEATMLLLPDSGEAPADPVGTSCRICPRQACPARREPAIVAAAH